LCTYTGIAKMAATLINIYNYFDAWPGPDPDPGGPKFESIYGSG